MNPIVRFPAMGLTTGMFEDPGCSLEDLLGEMDDRDGWREKAREIRAVSTT